MRAFFMVNLTCEREWASRPELADGSTKLASTAPNTPTHSFVYVADIMMPREALSL